MFGEKLRTQAWDTLRGEVLARKDNRKSKATTSIVLDVENWHQYITVSFASSSRLIRAKAEQQIGCGETKQTTAIVICSSLFLFVVFTTR